MGYKRDVKRGDYVLKISISDISRALVGERRGVTESLRFFTCDPVTIKCVLNEKVPPLTDRYSDSLYQINYPFEKGPISPR